MRGMSSSMQSHGYVPVFATSRSATATPTGSPKKRQLPQIPQQMHRTLRDRSGVSGQQPSATRSQHHASSWESQRNHYTGLSDSDLPSRAGGSYSGESSRGMGMSGSGRPSRRSLSPDGKDPATQPSTEFVDSDIESVVSVTSSAFSTQSERPRGSRGLRYLICF